jgi:hypothetical protein
MSGKCLYDHEITQALQMVILYLIKDGDFFGKRMHSGYFTAECAELGAESAEINE